MKKNVVRRHSAMGAALVGAMVVLAACTTTPDAEVTPTPTPTPSAATPYDGPIAFVGDELSSLLPSTAEIQALIPTAAEITEPSDDLTQISDGGGPEAVPAVCFGLLWEQSLSAVGTRTSTWTTPQDADHDVNRVMAMQFATPEKAQARMDQLIGAAGECRSFDYDGPASFESVVAEEKDGVRALAGPLVIDASWGHWQYFHGFAAVGNTLVHLQTTYSDEAPIDPAAAAELLRDTAVEAKSELIASLTADPPEVLEEPSVDPAAPRAEWAITGFGVGPIRFGEPVQDTMAGVPDAVATGPEYETGPWTLTSADGATALLIQPAADGTVESVQIGASADWDEIVVDGATAPSASGVRVGDMVSQAKAAYPGGTNVRITSSGQYAYFAADRQGQLLVFHTSRNDAEALDGAIIGITAMDASAWTDPSFE